MEYEEVVKRFLWLPHYLPDRSDRTNRKFYPKKFKWLIWANLVQQVRTETVRATMLRSNGSIAETRGFSMEIKESFLTASESKEPVIIVPEKKTKLIAFSNQQPHPMYDLVLDWRPKTIVGDFIREFLWDLFVRGR